MARIRNPAWKSNGHGKGVTSKTRLRIYQRDGGRCRCCGVATQFRKGHPRYGGGDDLAEIDHIVERADGGTSEDRNLQLLCKKCNRKKMGQSARLRRKAGE